MDAIGFDPLTGFLDRSGCLRAAVRLAEFCRRQDKPFAVLWADLDRFKQVNESFGHLGGDAVIAMVARRLGDTLVGRAEAARMGGDEFVFLVPSCDRRRAEEMADELLRTITLPIEVGNIRMRPSGSIGVAVLEGSEESLALIERADRAMLEAKRLGGGRYVVSGDEQVPGRVGVLLAREELVIESQIHAALESGGLTLHYQPIIDFNGGVESAEALMRCDVQGQSLAPGKIIPVAEKTGLISRLGEWSMLNAAQHARRLRDHGFAIKVAVNVSRAQLMAPRFVEALYAALYCGDIEPALLELELTESLFLDVSETVQANLKAARQAGVSLAIDDFGSGYAGLNLLADFQPDLLKLDMELIRGIDQDSVRQVLVDGTLQMCRRLGVDVIAEGVETVEHHRFLQEHGCPAFQGYLFGRPEPLEAFEQRVLAG